MYQSVLIWKPGCCASTYPGIAKMNTRSTELASDGSVLPMPWNMLDVTNTTPLATKFQLTMCNYSVLNAITAGSLLKIRTMSSDTRRQTMVSTTITAALIAVAE